MLELLNFAKSISALVVERIKFGKIHLQTAAFQLCFHELAVIAYKTRIEHNSLLRRISIQEIQDACSAGFQPVLITDQQTGKGTLTTARARAVLRPAPTICLSISTLAPMGSCILDLASCI